MFKKLSVFLSLLMIICMLSVGTAVMAAVEEVGMNFDEDGTAGLNIEAYAGIFDNPAYLRSNIRKMQSSAGMPISIWISTGISQ